MIGMNQHFRKHQHLLRGDEFRRTYAARNSVADGVLIVYAVGNQLGYSRIGLSVSRKVGNAVVRNWWKRRIRESFRLTQSTLPVGIDFVVIPRTKSLPDFKRLSDSFETLCHRVYRKLDRAKASS